jgi:hypothetical protein
MNITNIKFDQIIYFSEDIEYFTEIEGINPIPTNTIVHKTITGIGATHSEIISDRHSIIVLPHISIVTSKNEHYKENNIETLAIHGEIKDDAIYRYLFEGPDNAKILTTPKGLDKLIRVMNNLRLHFPELDYKEKFFLLIDESHKIIQDAEYRPDMVDIMEHFFDFKNKAMVSATPIPPSDPRFKQHNFKHIKVTPDYDFRQEVDLVHSYNIVETLERFFQDQPSECYCIFFNSVSGIKSVIDHLKIADYKIFCSKESVDILKLNHDLQTSYSVDSDLQKYNFFTSSFFNGLDIITDHKPDIIIITDRKFGDHSLLDPYTDTVQIIGRFRKKKQDELPYKRVRVINNANYFTNPITEKEAFLKFEKSRAVYNHINTLKQSLANVSFEDLFAQALKTIKPYSKLIKTDGKLSYFLLDNYLNDERSKGYYSSAADLRTAYNVTRLYRVNNIRDESEDIVKANLSRRNLRYTKAVNAKMAQMLLNLEQYAGLDVYHEQRYRIAKLSFVVYDGYCRLGYDVLCSLKFSKIKIINELLKLDIANGLNKFPVINLVHQTFQLNRYYTWSEIKAQLQKIFDEFGLKYCAKAKDVERYFEFISRKKGDSRVYLFIGRKQFTVSQQHHV